MARDIMQIIKRLNCTRQLDHDRADYLMKQDLLVELNEVNRNLENIVKQLSMKNKAAKRSSDR